MSVKDFRDNPLYKRARGEKDSVWMTVLCILVIALMAFFVCVRFYVRENYGGVIVDGDSMNNTLVDGDALLMKYTEKGAEADYGDVIVVYVGGYSEWADVKDAKGNRINYIIKRLIAKDGDTVKAENGQLYLMKEGETEFSLLNEPYAYYSAGAEAYQDFYYRVDEGEIFFLGDNRMNSNDSRYAQGHSELNRLYKEEDIYGVVPQWAIEYRKTLEFFFLNNIK